MKEVLNIDCFEWLAGRAPNSIHAVCTDPPYGLVEFTSGEVAKLRGGKGGVWRIPPTLGGKQRNPLPRFSVLTLEQRFDIERYFREWGEALMPALLPGAHVLVASNPVLSSHVFQGLLAAGLEPRATMMRVYHGFRGGDRPKNAEAEFPDLCVSPRGNYEPWLLFRRPISEKTVAQNLRKWGVGALRMLASGGPVPDVIPSSKTPALEKQISNHPCLKPQQLLRFFCRMLMPTDGVMVDPFMGSGSTIAACEALGIDSVGLEMDAGYYADALDVIPRLAALYPRYDGSEIGMPYTAPGAVCPEHSMLFEDEAKYTA